MLESKGFCDKSNAVRELLQQSKLVSNRLFYKSNEDTLFPPKISIDNKGLFETSKLLRSH